MALTQRGINIPVTGQFQDGDDIVDALRAQGLSVDSALGSAIAAAVNEANNYTDAAIENIGGTGGGGGGVTDHGALTGLSDDDHPQYHNDARGDARYYTKTQVDTALTGKADTGHTHTPASIGAAAASHQHAAGDITSGTIAPARLGTGTADDTKFLRGDGTWQEPPTGGGGVPLVASTAVGKWFTYPLFMSLDTNQWIRANKDMPLIITEEMSIDAVTMTVGTAPTEATVAVINLLDASRTFVQKVCDLPIPTATGDVTAVFTPLALSPGVYHLQTVGVAYGQPGNFGAKFTCGKVIGWDAGQGLSAPDTGSSTFPRRLASEPAVAPMTPMIWVRRSA